MNIKFAKDSDEIDAILDCAGIPIAAEWEIYISLETTEELKDIFNEIRHKADPTITDDNVYEVPDDPYPFTLVLDRHTLRPQTIEINAREKRNDKIESVWWRLELTDNQKDEIENQLHQELESANMMPEEFDDFLYDKYDNGERKNSTIAKIIYEDNGGEWNCIYWAIKEAVDYAKLH